ncbi:hypothetical protein BGL34_00295 [Fructilactobacillus lindneri]|uniref:DUF1146 domain-containing protein n=2 Tax=Fructilactobacillus lindneri TaxID=53444 RepID=A0A0R2JPZ6_9LACO|nr:DUF1146 family protein [Fructilactobacillus lindneri]ANZ58366.1 hypothetical protein AYR60_06285 [Fructilactobacillus lindneri]ANZ59688.1 hypothetical protein AYR59_06540 [Fructilactobacillus lindneri]KRN79202.1 hypothetical protein IV52_GL000609 [Fructilactobacillus lindneri DSM 20690 = JCM 11027]POG98529.1 hypothetical protein BGL31_00885 [Fructilactobacillus lindneri]POH03917.1 hypothetical protein BGL32_00825 [Fructilactobacillus lindneri]
MNVFGIQALMGIICQLFFIILSFWAIQGIHFERFLPIQEKQGKVLIVLLSIAIGFLCSSFFLSFIDNIKNLTLLF